MKQRLFIALDIPDTWKAELARLQPPANDRLRLIPPEQMHVTLHFIGLAEPAAVAAHLSAMRDPVREVPFPLPFPLKCTKPGIFRSRGRATLWLGLEKSDPLVELHQAIGAALHTLDGDIRNQNRRFSPHVTLARCRRPCPRQLVDRFLQQTPPALPPLTVNHVSLYASELTPEGPVYSLLQQFTFNSDC